ncbi:T-cell receptor beta-2 chain C region [Triplophysa tibetana]|nr:T-cell receptor beta-2 chain C region [Triplophysa tibetana]
MPYMLWYRQKNIAMDLIVFSYGATNFSDGVLITQWPKYITSFPGSTMEMNCYQNDTNYDYKYWYRQRDGEGPVLIASYVVNTPTYEKDFETGFTASDFSDGVLITQWPKYITTFPASTMEMNCYQNDTNYDYKYWYRQRDGEGPVLIASYVFNTPTYEKDFETGFTALGSEKKKWTLMVEVKNESDAVYLCAASLHNPAYFGEGTKLTVLALVCLATGFYPDHVSVYWKENGEERKDKVSTDPSATQDQGTLLYHISSRIKVTGTHWKNPENRFTCIVRFFDGETYHNITKTIGGQKVNPKMLKTIGFGYILFLAKSMLYALIVAGLVWKLKVQ